MALDAETSRPSSSSVTVTRTWSTTASSSIVGLVSLQRAGTRWRADTGARQGRSGCRRTGRAAGRPRRRTGHADEGPRVRRLELDDQHLAGLDLDLDLDLVVATGLAGRAVALLVVRLHHDRLVGDREQLDDHPTLVAVPAQGDRADPELLDDRLVERLLVADADRGDRRDRGVSTAAAQRLVEEQVDPLGEDRHLLLLQRHAGDPAALAGLEEEGPLSGLADRAGDEPVRLLEVVDDDRT